VTRDRQDAARGIQLLPRLRRAHRQICPEWSDRPRRRVP